MMADRQTTGGYPKLGAVISADLCKMAQLRAGEKVRFVKVTLDEAHEALRAQRNFLRSMRTLYDGVMKQKQELQIAIGQKRYLVEVTEIG
jgi:allophanate hydrolase subunit 2